MLRARHRSLTAKFEKHGIVVNDSVLADAKRRLVMLTVRATSLAKAVRRLEKTLGDLKLRFA